LKDALGSTIPHKDRPNAGSEMKSFINSATFQRVYGDQKGWGGENLKKIGVRGFETSQTQQACWNVSERSIACLILRHDLFEEGGIIGRGIGVCNHKKGRRKKRHHPPRQRDWTQRLVQAKLKRRGNQMNSFFEEQRAPIDGIRGRKNARKTMVYLQVDGMDDR